MIGCLLGVILGLLIIALPLWPVIIGGIITYILLDNF